MTSVSTCCIDVDTNLRITISIYNGTGRFLRISDFCIPSSEFRASSSDVRFSDFRTPRFTEMFGLRFLDFQNSRFPDFQISRFLDLP